MKNWLNRLDLWFMLKKDTLYHSLHIIRKWTVCSKEHQNIQIQATVHLIIAKKSGIYHHNMKTYITVAWTKTICKGKNLKQFFVQGPQVSKRIPLYAYSNADAIVVISVSMVRAQFSTSPNSFSDWLKFSNMVAHCIVCFDNWLTCCCKILASFSSARWLLYAFSTLNVEK